MKVEKKAFFDTVKVSVSDANAIAEAALKRGVNLRVLDGKTVSCFTCQIKAYYKKKRLLLSYVKAYKEILIV